MSNARALPAVGLVSLALLVRWLVAQFPYSGHGKPPMFGDYEAQRHWMEITTNLPVREWYRNSTANDLLYWGLDYPPLTPYHMLLLGQISNVFFNASWTELHRSRGLESYEHKIFMRSTVLISELIFYIPAVIYFFYKIKPIHQATTPSSVHRQNLATYCALVLFYPAQILIDHGHFQYNSVFLGLVLWSVILMIEHRQLLSAMLFACALCYKQMSLYYSLPFFWFIASTNLRVRPIHLGMKKILLVGLLVMSTFALIFSPYLHSTEAILQVMRRIFPFNRGLFEDKVANFWFSLSIFFKYRNDFSIEQLIQASTVMTLIFSLPAGLHILFKPTLRTFRYALVTTSMVFFLFSFQVHEKTILVPALPLLLLCREHPLAANWFVIVSTFSLQPLLIRDGQSIPYVVLMVVFTLFSLETFRGLLSLSLPKIYTTQNLVVVSYLTSISGCLILSLAAFLISPPPRYPHIHPTVNAFYSCVHFVGFLIFFYIEEFRWTNQRNMAADMMNPLKKTN